MSKTKFIFIIGYGAFDMKRFVQHQIVQYVNGLIKSKQGEKYGFDNADLEFFPESEIHPKFHHEISERLFQYNSGKFKIILTHSNGIIQHFVKFVHTKKILNENITIMFIPSEDYLEPSDITEYIMNAYKLLAENEQIEQDWNLVIQ